jgi:hypothetical protein
VYYREFIHMKTAFFYLFTILMPSLSALADGIDVNPERVSFYAYETETERGVVVSLFDGYGNRVATPRFQLFVHPKLRQVLSEKPHLRQYSDDIIRECELQKYKATVLKRQLHIGTTGIFYCSPSIKNISY